ncbi:MAG: response regulator [Candidatus Melainabacteria bacterium]|nr:response regulator [Candidatus Melainabacteria bacterium]
MEESTLRGAKAQSNLGAGAGNIAVLVIEDEAPIRRFLKMTLNDHGYGYKEALNGRDGLSEVAASSPSLVILDLGLPDIDGLEVTRSIRDWSDVPIIVLSARGQEKDKVEALDAGADDYLTKPFGVGELLARIRVAIRRDGRQAAASESSVVQIGAMRLDHVKRQVFFQESEVHLTPIEFKLLCALLKYPDRVLTHNHLLKEVWGQAYQGESHYLRVYMAQLRRKLERDPANPTLLITEPGIGYRLRSS